MKPLLSALDRLYFRDGATLIAGNLGAGKSYTAVRLACEFAHILKRPVYANFPIRSAIAKMAVGATFGQAAARSLQIAKWRDSNVGFSMLDPESIEAIDRYPRDKAGAVVILDEILLYHAEVAAILNDVIVQARKRRWLLLLLAQSPDALPRKYRTITAQYWRTVYAPAANLFGLHLVDRRVQTQRASKQVVVRRWHLRNRLWSLAFDSWYEFPSKDGLQLQQDQAAGVQGVPPLVDPDAVAADLDAAYSRLASERLNHDWSDFQPLVFE